MSQRRTKKALLAAYKDFPHVQDAIAYAYDVVAGDIIASQWVQLACHRQIDDLHRVGWEYVFAPEKAERVIKFCELMPHVKGRWAKRGETIECMAWWKFCVAAIYGWVDHEGLRRFRYVTILVPRKNAKTTNVAPLCLYELILSEEYASEVYCGASTENQAMILFNIAKKMVERTEELVEYYGVQAFRQRIINPDDGGWMQAIIRDPGDGGNPSLAVHDEFHEQPDFAQYDTMVTGMQAREEPLSIIISTAGSNTIGPCYIKQLELQAVLKGEEENNQLFGVIHTIDQGDRWDSVEAIRKANPSLGVALKEKDLVKAMEQSKLTPVKQATYKTKHLNVWVGSYQSWIDKDKWVALGDPDLCEADFCGATAVIAIDLAIKLDFTAICNIYSMPIDGFTHYYVFPRFHLPSKTIDSQHQYQAWESMGLIERHEGVEISFTTLEKQVAEDVKTLNPYAVTYDQWNAQHISQVLQEEHGAEVVTWGKSTQNYTLAMKEIEVAMEAGRIHHPGNAVMDWMMENVQCDMSRANDTRFPQKDKRDGSKKIDGAIAMIMGIGVIMGKQDDQLDGYLGFHASRGAS